MPECYVAITEFCLDLAEGGADPRVDGLASAFHRIAHPACAATQTEGADEFFLESLISALNAEATGAPGPTRPSDVLVDPLTTRELQVLGLLVGGLQLADIGAELYVSRNTVKSHASHIYTKLGVSGRSQAIDAARRLGLI